MPSSDYSIGTISQFVGQELGVSEWMTIDQERINHFAEFTGDHQWIHADVERAKFAAEASRILGGASELAPDRKDRRFQDPTWRENEFYRRGLQLYLKECRR